MGEKKNRSTVVVVLKEGWGMEGGVISHTSFIIIARNIFVYLRRSLPVLLLSCCFSKTSSSLLSFARKGSEKEGVNER